MANTNAQAVAWANNKVRPMVDTLYTAYLSAKSFIAQANAQAIYGTPIPNDSTLLADGAATDGRPPMTNAQATNIFNRCTEFINWMEQGLVASPFTGSVTNATLNTVAGIEVNGKAIV